jgi:hypothetical protein
VIASRRGALAVVALLLTLGSFVLLEPWLTPARSGQPGQTIPSMHTSDPDGARALALWLADLGYVVRSTEHRPFALGPDDRLLFQLDPSDDQSEAAVDAIVGWVERGGTLVLSARAPSRLTDRLGLGLAIGQPRLAEAVPRQPVFEQPAVRRVVVEATGGLLLREPGWTPLLGDPAEGGRIVAAAAPRGRGRVYALASAHPLTNAGLGQADDAALARRLLADLPPGGTVVFDEYHHGLTEHGTLMARLLGEPWGWAALYAAGLTFAYLALSGRRFGRVAPELVWPRPRPGGEHAVTLATLLRQGGHRGWLRQQYLLQLRRALGARFGVPADLPAPRFAEAIGLRRPEAAELGPRLAAIERAEDERSLLLAIRRGEATRRQLMEGR